MSFPDVLIRGGTLFDGDGGEGRRVEIAVTDGVVSAISDAPLEAGPETQVVDASGRWITPGFLDMHTHYDAEVEVAPALFESVQHGVTTVVTGSCSLSMAVGNPTDLADMFCRVEAIPREVVLPMFEQVKDWETPAEYLDHLDQLPLGPNVACLLGHSTIRAAAMGMERSLTKWTRPTHSEQAQMDAWLNEALDAGYVGLSISTLPWDKMDGDEFRSRPMPSVFASWREYRRMASILRQRGRVLQAIPNISTKLNVILFYLISASFGLRKALKTTLISMIDARSDRLAFRAAGFLARVFNKFFGADFRMQALPETFDLWADGIDIVVFEEFEAGTAALHLKDAVARNQLLADPNYRAKFKREWKRRWLPRAYHRNFHYSEIVACPDASLIGRSFNDLGEERGVDAVDAFLDLVIEHGNDLRWYTVLGNDRPEWLPWIVSHPDILIGFSDAGAHLRNMAHYNFPLRLLRLVQDHERAGTPFMTTGRAVQRVTSEIADWLGLEAGRVRVGARADLVVIDPDALTEQLAEVHEEVVPEYGGMKRLVRRNDDAVDLVLINGRVAARSGTPGPGLGAERGFGQVLRVGVEARSGAAQTDLVTAGEMVSS